MPELTLKLLQGGSLMPGMWFDFRELGWLPITRVETDDVAGRVFLGCARLEYATSTSARTVHLVGCPDA